MTEAQPAITWEFNEFIAPCGAWAGLYLERTLYLVVYHGEQFSLFYFPGGGSELELVTPGDFCKPTKAALKRELKAFAHVAEVHFQEVVRPVLEAALDALKAIGPDAKKRYRSIDDI